MWLKKSLLTTVCLLTILPSVHAKEPSRSVVAVEGCTTNSKIYYQKDIRAENLTNAQKRAAVLIALGRSSSNPGFAVKNFKGQWFFESETKEAIFAGYEIRSHYLNIAVIYTPFGLSTIICDSTNLKQKKGSIHKKAPVWKDVLDNKIRIEVGIEERSLVNGDQDVQSAKQLLSRGYITKDEFNKIKKRIEASIDNN